MRLSKPPEVAVEPKSPDDSFSFESEQPTISFRRLILLSSSPAERPTETTYSAITKNSNEALILSPNLVHNLHPFPSQLFNGLTQPDQQEPDNKVPPTNSVEPKPPSKPPDDSHVSKPPTKLSKDILSPKPPPWSSDDSHVTKSLTKLAEDVVEPKPPPWPFDDSHVSKSLTKLPDDVVEPKPPSWPPDNDAFEAEPATKPLDVSQHVVLTEPPDKIYAQYGFPILHFLTSDPPFFESACRGVHHGFPALGA